MIEQEEISVGESVYQCKECKKPCRQASLNTWYKLGNTTCPHCRTGLLNCFSFGPVVFRTSSSE